MIEGAGATGGKLEGGGARDGSNGAPHSEAEIGVGGGPIPFFLSPPVKNIRMEHQRLVELMRFLIGARMNPEPAYSVE